MKTTSRPDLQDSPTSEVFFLAVPKDSYLQLMEKAREKQTTVAVLLANALKLALA